MNEKLENLKSKAKAGLTTAGSKAKAALTSPTAKKVGKIAATLATQVLIGVTVGVSTAFAVKALEGAAASDSEPVAELPAKTEEISVDAQGEEAPGQIVININ